MYIVDSGALVNVSEVGRPGEENRPVKWDECWEYRSGGARKS
jgi:hypothetical protein